MIKILHSGDWHLDAPLQGRTPQQAQTLRQALLEVPRTVARICREERCDLMLLSGDLFDGSYTQATFRAVREALESVGVPVFISPGNHDYIHPDSPYIRELWPENVHIFKKQQVEWVELPALSLRVYGAAFQSQDCPGLLEGFRAEGRAVGVFHGDPTQIRSPYNPVTRGQAAESGLAYLALGHVHKGDSFRAGQTLCAWSGCPMGRGWDEPGQKGVLLVTLETEAEAGFLPLDTPRFYDLTVDAAQGPAAVLPGAASEDFFRVTLTGEAEKVDLEALQAAFSQFPNLVLRDQTVRPVELWQNVGSDSFEGMFFGLLKEALKDADEETTKRILLAAKLSRQILDGQEVKLP